ncbi:DUF2069 domain-containing protein [Shewanella cyperi]|uniref:DUF2069 domain-containing protein n=1 Tax=Shewanella cyperi TaxID=2814292 RepID=A0A975AMK3_9GAMM|nr:DUF2069 domain-containing protein [Shewanella cyperi]QSX31547.1 DUF2069 domain-containing protein [Shewanella cyperi]QSX42327.1 DUF2069 domain-containing protein [Shewanella cyperi]
MAENTRLLLLINRIGYPLLLLLLGYWFLGNGAGYSMAFNALWLVPLLLPLPGIMQGKPYTHAWASFILCLYLLHGLTLLYVAGDKLWFAILEVGLLALLSITFPFYARLRGRELGLGLKKKTKE